MNKKKVKSQWGKFEYIHTCNKVPEKCRGCVWNEYIRCGVDWCSAPHCLKEGGGCGERKV